MADKSAFITAAAEMKIKLRKAAENVQVYEWSGVQKQGASEKISVELQQMIDFVVD